MIFFRRFSTVFTSGSKGNTRSDRCHLTGLHSILERCQYYAAHCQHETPRTSSPHDWNWPSTCDRICFMATETGWRNCKSWHYKDSSTHRYHLFSFITDIWLDLCLPESDDQVNDLIDKIYPHVDNLNNISDNKRWRYFSERVILAAKNSDVDVLNEMTLDRLEG